MKNHRNFFYTILCSVLIVTGLLLTPLAVAQTSTASKLDLPAIDAFLQSQVTTNHIPGLAIAIVQGDQIVFMRGYGEATPGQPVTPQTQFYLGSVTKSFTALAIMQLVEQGRLDLDAPVQRYLPWFRVADKSASETITVRHLLNQTSGLSEASDPGAAQYAPTLADQVRTMQEARPNAPVGRKFQYYNKNYQALGLLIEQVSGQSYSDYMRDNIFGPLSMTHTVTDPAYAPNLAQGYGQVFGFPFPRAQEFRPGGLPGGYIISNAEDMTHYLLAQLNNARYGEHQLVQPATLVQIHTPPPGIESNYGMGWLVFENGNTLYHNGNMENFHVDVVLGLKEKIGLVILSNQNSLFSMITSYPATLEGVVQLLNGKPAAPNSFTWLGLALAALVMVDMLNHLRLFWQLPKWTIKTAGQRRGTRWLKVLSGLVIRLALLFGLPLLLGRIMEESASWPEMFNLLPDVTGWLLVTIGLGVVRGLVKVVIITRPIVT